MCAHTELLALQKAKCHLDRAMGRVRAWGQSLYSLTRHQETLVPRTRMNRPLPEIPHVHNCELGCWCPLFSPEPVLDSSPIPHGPGLRRKSLEHLNGSLSVHARRESFAIATSSSPLNSIPSRMLQDIFPRSQMCLELSASQTQKQTFLDP